jgi:hypothetical protein
MLHLVLLTAGLLVGQVPPPPAPRPTESYEQSPSSPEQSPPADPEAQREWLLAHLIVDMQAQGKYDAQKYHEIEAMLKGMSPSQLLVLVGYYQQRKAQVEAWQLSQAEANLHRLEAYRDHLKRELAGKIATRQQEEAITAYSSSLAAQQAQWAMQNFYAAQAWPYYANRPYYPRHHYYRW